MATNTQQYHDAFSDVLDVLEAAEPDQPIMGLWVYTDLAHVDAPTRTDVETPRAFNAWLGSKTWTSRGAVSNAPVRVFHFGNEYTAAETYTVWIGHHNREGCQGHAAGFVLNLNRSAAVIDGKQVVVWYPDVLCDRMRFHDLDDEKVSVGLWQMVLYEFNVLIRKDLLDFANVLNRRFTAKSSSRVPFTETTHAGFVLEDRAGGGCRDYSSVPPGSSGYRMWEREQGATKHEATVTESVRRYYWALSAARNSDF
jgi:hypothetical protein